MECREYHGGIQGSVTMYIIELYAMFSDRKTTDTYVCCFYLPVCIHLYSVILYLSLRCRCHNTVITIRDKLMEGARGVRKVEADIYTDSRI